MPEAVRRRRREAGWCPWRMLLRLMTTTLLYKQMLVKSVSVDRGTAEPSGRGPGRPTRRGRDGAHPSLIRGKRPGPREGRSMNTASRRVLVRELGPDDADVVDVVFAGLSPRGRYLRFQFPISELSAATRRSLTAVDGHAHVALAAFASGRPIGIVRI